MRPTSAAKSESGLPGQGSSMAGLPFKFSTAGRDPLGVS
jgi:hypothetical protein